MDKNRREVLFVYLSDENDTNENNPVCPSCGTSFKDFLDTGLFGCEYCYTVFEKKLLPYLFDCQGADRHYRLVSTVDEEISENFETEKNLETLRLRYNDFIAAGNYEDAETTYRYIQRIERALADKRSGR